MNKIRILLTAIVIIFCCLLSGCDYENGNLCRYEDGKFMEVK